MTRIIRDVFNPADKEQEIVFAGDRDFGSSELRRLQYDLARKDQRVGDSLYPAGYLITGLAATIRTIQNLLAWSNTFTAWTAVAGATVDVAATVDRYGNLTASRLNGSAGMDALIELAAGVADGRRVISLDVKLDTTPVMKLGVFDGVVEIAELLVTLTNSWQRVELVIDDAWSIGATTLTVRVRPAPGLNPGSCFIAMAQVEAIELGNALAAGRYIETTGEASSGPGNVASFSAGSIYAGGLPRPVAAQVITFDPLVRTGVEVIYAEVAERYLDGDVHRPLLDNPVSGGPGNDSVREETKLVVSDTTDAAPAIDIVPLNPQYRSKLAVAAFQFDRALGTILPIAEQSVIDVGRTSGTLQGRRIDPQSIPEDRLTPEATENQPGLIAMVARRLANQSGPFVVTRQGSAPTVEQDLATVSVVRAKVEPLDGYTPDGRAHYLEVPKYIETPLQTSTNERNNETHTYYFGTDTYAFGKTPVTGVRELTGIFEVTQVITRGVVPGGTDDLANGPVFQVVSVVQGATTYRAPNGPAVYDFEQVGDAIDWSINGAGVNEPAPGSSYTVVYRYTRTWPVGEYSFTANAFTFIGANRPVATLPITVDFDYGQGRVDLLYLGPDGLAVAQGAPSDHPAPPPEAQGTMALWEISIGFNALAATFTPRFTVGFTMKDIAETIRQMQDMVYNVAQLAAQSGLRDRNTALKGMFTDPFIDDRQSDPFASFFTGPGERVARIDKSVERLRMAQDTTQTRATLDMGVGRTTFQIIGEWAGLPYVATNRIIQNLYSKTESLNPFANYAIIPPLITASTAGWAASWWDERRNLVTIGVTIKGTRFQPNEAGILVKVDGQLVATVTADAQGEFATSFTRTLNPQAIASATGAGGTPEVSFSTNFRWPRRDPLAQTFVPSEDSDLTHIDLYFSAKHPTEHVTVTIRNTQAGLPTEEVLAMKTLKPSDINLGGLVTRVVLPRPLPVLGGVSYGAVAASNSTTHHIQIAQLSKQNLGVGGGYITSNAYGEGVLLASSDGRTWTPYQDQDMRFAVGFAKYSPSAALYLNPIAYPGGVTSFRMLHVDRVVFGATISWQYSVDGELSWVPFDPRNEIQLSSLAAEIRIRALASTTKDYAGITVNVQNIIVLAYKNAIRSSIVSLLSSLFQTTTSAKAYLESRLKPGTAAPPFATVNNGATWIAGTLTNTRAIDNSGLAEYEYSFTFPVAGSQFRSRIDLTTGDPCVQAEVEKASFVIL